MTTYGDFPGVRVETNQGAVQSVSIGVEEKLVIVGPATYTDSGAVDGDGTAATPTTINSPLEAERYFGEGARLAEAMKEALSNGANIDYLYGVAVPRDSVSNETQGSQTGSLENIELVENTDTIVVEDVDGAGDVETELDVEFRYNGAPATPTDTGTVFINPLTGEYAAGISPTDTFEFSYEYDDYTEALGNEDVYAVVEENETGLFWALSDSDAVSATLNTTVQYLRDNYQLVTGFAFAEPNSQKVLDTATPEDGGAEARYDTSTYETDGNQSVTSEALYKPAPARVAGEYDKTIGGGLAGLYAGKPIDDAVYNEVVSGYTGLQQSLNKTEADELRDAGLIPVRSGGSIRVKGNRSTAYGENGSVAADFWTRRITDRVILIVKQVADATIGRINNEDTRGLAQERINLELGKLASDGVIEANSPDETNYNVQVYEDSTNRDEVNIDVQFTPFGIVKQVDTTVTVNV